MSTDHRWLDPPSPGDGERLATLSPDRWERANREMIAKILSEFAYEELLHPERVGEGGDGDGDTAGRTDGRTDTEHATFALALPDGARLEYTARHRAFGWWQADPASLRWSRHGRPAPLPDVGALVALAAPALGASPSTTAGAITEVANTLLSDVWQLARGRDVEELLDAPAAELEGEMRGHPWIVANKGRLGFDADDLARFAPEARRPVRLHWLAVGPDRADVRTVDGLGHHRVVQEQVGDAGWDALRRAAAAAGFDPDTAVYLPVHPWQWAHRVVPLHAADLAAGRMALLGTGAERYLPTQSIRTLVDADHPERRSLKLPLSILNTSVYRGLPRARTLAAPALTQWLLRLAGADPYLRETGLVMLGEEASVSVAHPAFEAVPDVPYQHTELLGAIWRAPVDPELDPGERALTMAALLHRDPAGRSFAARLVERSGLAVGDWVDRLHDVTLPPLLHVLYRFGLAFSPHAQNCLLGLRDDAPARLVVKDFVDDVMVSAVPVPELEDLPEPVRAVMGGGVEPMILTQWIQSGVLVCVHRYLAAILDDDLGFPERAFWASARRAVRAYQDRFTGVLDDRFALFDVDAPLFVKLCLNRVRLLERGYADGAERPVASAVGWVDNPLALDDVADDVTEGAA